MKHAFFKSLWLLLLVTITSGCEPSTEGQGVPTETPNAHNVEAIPIEDFFGLSAYRGFEKSLPGHKKGGLGTGKKRPDREFEYIGSKVLHAVKDGQSTYSVAVRDINGNDAGHGLNLLFREDSSGVSTFLVKYPKDDGNITIQPINQDWGGTAPRPTLTSKNDEGGCVDIFWEVTTPCGCSPAHTSGSCSCHAPYSSKSGVITICWDEPIWIKTPPAPGGPDASGGSGASGNSSTGLPSSTQGNSEPVYIYQGEEQCFSGGTCTPQLYWAQVEAGTKTEHISPNLAPGNAILNLGALTEAQMAWLTDPGNSDKVNDILAFVLANNNSDEAKEFVKEIIDFHMDIDWKSQLKRALADGITSTAELMHRVYKKLNGLANTYPSSIGYINGVVDELREIAEDFINTNPNSCTWGDLFNMWLFEIGDNPINITSNSAVTTTTLKLQEGVNEARDDALLKIQTNDLQDNKVSNLWVFGQNEAYDSVSNKIIETAFLGSYNTKVEIIQISPSSYQLKFTVKNTSSWSSATRFRIDNDGDGQHDGIFPDKQRGDGIHLGGNFSQEWNWTENL